MLPIAILAGGLATRLGSLTEKIPKSLIPIDREPFIAHQLRLLRRNGIERVILCVGHLGEQIEKTIGNGASFGVQVTYSYDGPSLKGTAGAVRTALPQLGESFFVMYGDSYLACDYSAVERGFSRHRKLALMTVFRNNGQWDSSNVEFEDGRLLAYSKKNHTARMHHIDYGLGVFRTEAFSRTRATDLADAYSDLLEIDELAAMEVHERFYEIGSPAGLQETKTFLSGREESRK
jgi:NDP-sugar pyrophosphorylase family protein